MWQKRKVLRISEGTLHFICVTDTLHVCSPLCAFRKSQAGVFISESLGPQSVGSEYKSHIYVFQHCQFHPSVIRAQLFLSTLHLSSLPPLFSPQFNFFNCFASLFYIAFVMQDMVLLRQVGLPSLRPFLLFIPPFV